MRCRDHGAGVHLAPLSVWHCYGHAVLKQVRLVSLTDGESGKARCSRGLVYLRDGDGDPGGSELTTCCLYRKVFMAFLTSATTGKDYGADATSFDFGRVWEGEPKRLSARSRGITQRR